MSKDLTTEQLREAKNLDKTLRSLANIKDALKHYKLDDVYILEEWDSLYPQNVSIYETSMGFPAKFKVVYISSEGIPYLRKLTAIGNPTGEVWLPPEVPTIGLLKTFNGTSIGASACQRFVLDPEALDSILLQSDFDPMAQHRDKSKLFNAINKHNKSVAIPTGGNDFNKIADFFKTRKPGDKFWTSPDKLYVIQSVAKMGKLYVITCTDMNQATVAFNFSHFLYKRLYKEQPRSFSKESVK